MNPLALDYFQHDDVVFLSRDLLGKFLFTCIDGCITGGMITETEAYRGPEDRASHAYNNRRTPRNEVMYHRGGVAYVYRCYGIHNLFNIVTNIENIPHAILIRAIAPTIGIEQMEKRRRMPKESKSLTDGPGKVSQALGIDKGCNGLPLKGPLIWLEDRCVKIDSLKISAGPRIGVDYAGKDALLPWRFTI